MYLNCHSYYSLRYGTLSVEKLVETAKNCGVGALALTDINNSTGIMDFVKECDANGIRPVAGIEFKKDDQWLYTGIARNNEGFRELNEFLTYHNLHEMPLPAKAPVFENVSVIYPFTDIAFSKRKIFSQDQNMFVGIKPSEIRRLATHPDRKLLLCNAVVLSPVTFIDEDDYDLHKNLRAIDNNILFSHLKPAQICSPEEFMMPEKDLKEIFKDYPQIISNTEKLLGESLVTVDRTSVKNKKTFTGNPYDDKILLEKLTLDGFEYRYGKRNKLASARIRHELDIIDRMGFSSYFLITADIIRYSMSRGFYHVGRGSGANSIVAYCLRITDVDPIELDLYFERFINPKRTSPPDFDIDYSWKERDDVLDYIFKRYGHQYTALLGAMSTFKSNSIYRELGKVHGLPKQEMDQFLRHPEEVVARDGILKKISAIGARMVDFPNLRTIHAGGVIISDEPITSFTALDLPPKGFPTTQWDMYVAEDIGFEKLDILSQRGIGHIKEASEIVLTNCQIKVDVHQVEKFKKDLKVKELLRSGDTIGCFYVESPAMRQLLKKLHCDNYITLVAASSIIRPGVARSGMMKEYIYRFHHPNDFSYLHPVMEEQLKETYGVMVYQEDVLKICHHFAGLDLADSDVLRRAMSGKYRSKKEFQRIVDKFFSNCKKSGYPDEVTKEVWRQIESFAGYSFSKAHSASYAVESFQSLYLKSHFPLEFMVAVINNFGGFYASWVYFNEAKNWGAKLNLPCVNSGFYKTSITGKDIYVGFVHVMNLEREFALKIEEERQNGLYKDLEDFVNRTQTPIEQLIILIRTGAFRFTGKTKSQLLWEAHLLTGNNRVAPHEEVLFKAPVKNYELPELVQTITEDVYDEIELLGFSVNHSYFDLLETKFRGDCLAQEMLGHAGESLRMMGQLVTIKYARTIHNDWMNFGTFVDITGHIFDTVHFPPSLKKYPFRGDGIYLVKGKITEEFGYPVMTVEKMAKMPVVKDPRAG